MKMDLDNLDIGDIDFYNEYRARYNIFMSNWIENEDIIDKVNNEELMEYNLNIYKKLYKEYKMYSCDKNITPEIANKYEVGQVLYQPNFAYVTSSTEGINKNYRFLVFSPDIAKISEEEYPFNLESTLSRTQIAEAFKVIDIYKKDGKTQISLLNYPIIAESLFKNDKTVIEKKLIKKAHESFDNSLKLKPLSDLDNYRIVLDDPIGIREYYGEYKFYTETDIMNYLLIISDIYDKLGEIGVSTFINEEDTKAIINNFQEDIDELEEAFPDASPERLMFLKRDLFYEYKNDVIGEFEYFSDDKLDELNFLDNQDEDMINDIINEVMEENVNESTIRLIDDQGNDLIPLLNVLEPSMMLSFLIENISSDELKSLKGYDEKKFNEYLENTNENAISEFLKDNEEEINILARRNISEDTIKELDIKNLLNDLNSTEEFNDILANGKKNDIVNFYDKEGNLLFPELSYASGIEIFDFLFENLGINNLISIKGYGKVKIEKLHKSTDEKEVVKFLQKNEKELNNLIIGQMIEK